ncbi:extracellular solute-binding protein [Paenibacillus arenilitoris]|uniref:Extracellular solute-binding protein n=1 Tax=Paenibacillus arenilitoris TaxID=2772299 RepID=A0A927H7K2_9BACL|nr:extracellular solute-binding protein [Paenibacillus arenilitoris]MBD2871711.1 extracellular solute-binding protein [Paenibacillus arenilitoris]
MKKLKLIVSGATAAAMVLAMTACASDSGNPEASNDGEGGDRPISLRMLTSVSPVYADFDNMMVWKEYEAKSGIHVNWEQVPDTSFVEKRNILLASGDVPDAIFRAQLQNSDLVKYGADGVFIPLNDLIEEHAPNLKRIFEQYPEVKEGITQPDGNIYSLPFINDFPSANYGSKLFLNEKWMNKIGAAEPTTTEEFYELLKAFRDKDANGNGQMDEVPLTAPSIDSISHALRGFWGLGNRGSAHPYVDMDEEKQSLRFIPADARYKELLAFMARLYKEKLLDEEIFTMNNAKMTAKGEADTVGSFVFVNPVPIGQTTKDDFAGMNALVGPHGDQLIAGVNPTMRVSGAFVITSVNPYPEETMKWADYWYSEEGMKLFFMGVEGETFRTVGNDQYEYVEEITKNPNGLTLDEAVGQYLAWPGSGQPTMQTEKFSKGGASYPSALAGTEKVSDYFPDEVWPAFTHTDEESALLASIGNDLTTYVNEMTVRFITGAASFSEWDNYIQTLGRMGLEQYMDAYRQAYERYSG